MVHDFVDPADPQGRTYKQANAEKRHAIPIGMLVDISVDDPSGWVVGAAGVDGMRLYVVRYPAPLARAPVTGVYEDPPPPGCIFVAPGVVMDLAIVAVRPRCFLPGCNARGAQPRSGARRAERLPTDPDAATASPR
jgi:hypothetical protein